MKTQLLEDFDESGSAPANRPAAPPRPAVWQRPRREPGAAPAVAAPAAAPQAQAVPAPGPTPQPRTAADPQPAPPAPAQAGARPRGFAPQPAASGNTTVPLGDAGMPAFAQGMPGGGDPDWLTERLARDAALHERPAWNGAWSRRLASWGAGGALLALLAGGGFWLYQESRVEDALVVVANESPAPAAGAGGPVGVAAPVAARAAPLAAAPAAPLAVVPAAPLADVPAAPLTMAPPASDAAAVGATAAPSTAAGAGEPQAPVFADRSVTAVAADGAAPSRQGRKSSHAARAQREGRAEAKAEARGGEPSARQRHEELLMQCRAHGYAERQCLENGCEMTRYGFACKG